MSGVAMASSPFARLRKALRGTSGAPSSTAQASQGDRAGATPTPSRTVPGLPQLPRHAGAEARRAPRTAIARLPKELLQHIGSMLPDKDLVALRQTNRAIGDALQPQVDSARAELKGFEVETIDNFLTMLAGTDGIARSSLRARPLAALAKVIFLVPEDERSRAFLGAGGHVDSLDAEHRAQPLTAMAKSIAALPEREKMAAFQAALRKLDALPAEHRAQPLTALAKSIEEMPQGERAAALGMGQGKLDGVLPEHRVLPEAALAMARPAGRGAAIHEVLNKLDRVPTEDRAQGVVALAEFILALPPDGGQRGVRAAAAGAGPVKSRTCPRARGRRRSARHWTCWAKFRRSTTRRC